VNEVKLGEPQSGRGEWAAALTGMAANDQVPQRNVAAVRISSLRAGYSPRLQGEEKAHIAWLAETEAPLPPILVERHTMRVIDGMHRLRAATLKGQETINVEFFDGSPADAFLRAVAANVTHGLPLSQADRRAAAARIIISHPQLSDRAIGESAGLSARTVASIRRSTGGVPQLNARVGRDGKIRPLDRMAGRRRAAELLAGYPRASLREVAKAAGVSPATAGDVRRRLARGEEPGLAQSGAAGTGDAAELGKAGRLSAGRSAGMVPSTPASALQKLLRDPSLRYSEQGRRLLHLLLHNATGPAEWSGVAAVVPPHCAVTVVLLAREYARTWRSFAQELDERARVIGPSA
jgi:ParB-like chromosome segregation protein Spo0J